MKTVKNKISIDELRDIAQRTFGNIVKAVVDVEKEIMVIGGDLHADEETVLLEKGSKQKDLWGINLYPELRHSDDWLEFDSMINIRPSLGNKTRGVEDEKTKTKIVKVINQLVKK